MKIHFTQDAQVVMDGYFDDEHYVLLDFDDSNVQLGDQDDTSSLIISFRFIVAPAKKDTSAYSLKVSSNLGDVFMKEAGKKYLKSELIVDTNDDNADLNIKNDSGLLDNDVPIEQSEV